MRARTVTLLAAASLLAAPAVGSDAPDEPLLDTFRTWTQRAQDELRLPDAPPPARTSIATADVVGWGVRASMGGITGEGGRASRPTRVEVVVSDGAVDSSRFRAGDRFRGRDSWQRLDLVIEDVPIAIARDLWMATDASYKSAVAALEAKAGSFRATGGDRPGDWSPAPAVTSIVRGPIEEVDQDRLRELVVQGSAVLRDLGGLHRATAGAGTSDGHYLLVTSEGTTLVQPEGYATLRLFAGVRRDDGVEVTDEVGWVRRRASDLPDLATVKAAADQLGRSVKARAAAEVVDFYEGPVVFEGEAAADFFRYLLPPEMRGTPPLPKADESYQEQTRSGPRVGRKLLPDGWSVVDDPGSATSGEAGGFVYDREGVRAEAVTLVDDGWVRGLVMSRVPRLGATASNGHARGRIQSHWESRLSLWSVSPGKRLNQRQIDKELARIRKGAELDRILVVRRLAPGKEGSLPRPTDAVWRSADGTETPVVSLLFQRVDRRTLRDVAAAGGSVERAYLAPFRADQKANARSGLPMVVRAPGVLVVQNVEAVFPGPDEKPFVLGPPATP